MKFHELKPAAGSRHRRKIVGRGIGSGHGAQCCRGMKGQTSRSGDSVMKGFEGGQMPLIRRIPKRGFSNRAFQTVFEVVNVGELEKHFDSSAAITPDLLRKAGFAKRGLPVKILGDGKVSKSLTVEAHAFSKSASDKITKAGGSVKVLNG